MIKIVESKAEIKKYTEALKALFKLYKLEENKDPSLGKLVKMVESGEMYDREPAKKELFLSHFLGGCPVDGVAKKINFSRSYLYSLKQEMQKELAMIVFEVIII